jgi:hypothetical protein
MYVIDALKNFLFVFKLPFLLGLVSHDNSNNLTSDVQFASNFCSFANGISGEKIEGVEECSISLIN